LTFTNGSSRLKIRKTEMSKPDQRKKKRISMIAAAAVRPSPSGPPIEAYIINISYGGLGLYVKEPLEGRVQTAISLRVGTGKRVTETVWGNVTWKNPVGSSYAVGISFEGLNPKDHRVLLSYLESWQVHDPATQAEIATIPSLTEQDTLS
jgi:c-di-GMP-binding flagellar brake protein YcgR